MNIDIFLKSFSYGFAFYFTRRPWKSRDFSRYNTEGQWDVSEEFRSMHRNLALVILSIKLKLSLILLENHITYMI